MKTEVIRTFTAFAGQRRLGSGRVEDVLLCIKTHLDRDETESILVFDDRTGEPIDFDLRGSIEETIARLAAHPLFSNERAEPKRPGPGRPKLGVISREVSLLPRHWDWLEAQPGGMSVALRGLVETARKQGQGKLLARRAREAAGKFMWTMAGDLANFEEASRALYAKDDATLETVIGAWPQDIRQHVLRLAHAAAELDARAEAGSAEKM